MKLGRILLGASMLIATVSFSQDGEDRECLRMRKIANDALVIKDYKEATTYFLKGETICGNYDASNYGRLTGSLRRLINAEKDKEIKKLYSDTLIQVWNRMDEKGLYEKKDDMVRGYFYLQLAAPNYLKADFYFSRGVKEQGTAVKEMYIPQYYYNTYTLFFMEQDAEKKNELKKRMISDYFELSKLVTEANFSIKAQESLTAYFNTVVQSCDDLTPEIAGFIEDLSTEPEAAKGSLMNMITLMEEKKCTESQEYMDLINKYLEIDPESNEALKMKVKVLVKNGKRTEAIAIYRKLKEAAPTDEEKQAYQYEITVLQFNAGQYKVAFKSAMSVSGSFRSKALAIAGQCVGQTANNCGESTFLRKCNNLYAVQLLEQAGSAGAGKIAKYKKNFPTSQECFQESNPASVTLTCWGVTVSPCK